MSFLMSSCSGSVFSIFLGSSNSAFFFSRSFKSFLASSNSLFNSSCFAFCSSAFVFFSSVFLESSSSFFANSSNFSILFCNFCSNSSCLKTSRLRSSSFIRSLLSSFIFSNASCTLFLSSFSSSFCNSLYFSFNSGVITLSNNSSNSFCFSRIFSSGCLYSLCCSLFCLFSFFIFSTFCCNFFCLSSRSSSFFFSSHESVFFSAILRCNSLISFCTSFA